MLNRYTYRTRSEALGSTHADSNYIEAQDHLQLMLRYAQRERPEELHNLDNISRRLTAANFGSMHQTSIQVTNLLLDILGSEAEFNTIAILRDEADQIMGKDNQWTKGKIRQMRKADSVARETLRRHSYNKQTVDLLNRERSVFQTKLRHVDIHQLWIRQEVLAKRLSVEWVKTTDMPADGLTKGLPSEKHTAFIKQLGIEILPSI